jgi:diguanylate cyclase (GGDEF)-like protein/PAS domain S-box-containing protein
VAYLLVGSAWIVLSDSLVARTLIDDSALIEIGMVKGLVFILATSVVLYTLMRRQQQLMTAALRECHVPVPRPSPGRAAIDPAFDPNTDWLGELAEASPECIGVVDLDGRACYLNPAARRLLGVTEEALARGIHASQFYTPEDWRVLEQQAWPALRREGWWQGELRVVGTDESVPVHQVLVAHRDAGGMVTHVSTHAQDLREARSQDISMRRSADMLANTAEGIIFTDTTGRIEWTNRPFTTMLGYSLEELQGCSLGEFGEAGFDHQTFGQFCGEAREYGHWEGELALRRSNSEIFPVRMSMSAFREKGSQVSNFICILSDLTHYKHFESQLNYMANHDPLTGLPNTGRFQEDLGEALAGLGEGEQICVLVLDLYDFKVINESFGRQAGDEVLVEVTRRLLQLETEKYRLARFGGDEFGIFIAGPAKEISPALEAERVREIFRHPYYVGDAELYIGGSIGVVLAPEDGLDVHTLIQNAEIGVKRARDRGQNAYEFYSEQLRARSTETIMIASGLRQAIREEEFRLVYQPIMRLADCRPCGVEALVRWSHPELGVISPDRFIPVAERTGMIQALGDLVLRHACRDFSALLSERPDFHIAVNVSPLQIESGRFSDEVLKLVREAGVRPEQVELEITESLMMRDPERTKEVFRTVTDMGFSISIDDFGTGFSSLAMLKRFPAQVLKIDQSFTRGLPDSADDAMMTRTIIAMARGLALKTVAEGIETRQQLDFLVEEGCARGQGYYFSRPLPLDEIREYLAD